MKKKILSIAAIIVIALTSSTSFAHNVTNEMPLVLNDSTKTETFKVYGNCGMCKKAIEGSLNNVKGIEKTDWDKSTKIMTVTFDEVLITLDEIKKKIADAGYDSDQFRSTDESYNDLPGCCQYDRPDMK